jgi:putative tricarboxylic transport membrane protein
MQVSTVDDEPMVVGPDEGAAPGAAPGPSGGEAPTPEASHRVIGPRIAGGVLVAVGLLLLVNAIQGATESGATGSGVTLGGPRLAPLVVAGGWVVLAAIYFVQQLVRPDGPRIRVRTPLLLIAVLVGYALVLKYTVVGYVIATTVFFVAAARLLSVRPWREVVVRDVAVAAGLSLGVYLAFTRLLGIALPSGVLPL